MWGRQFDSASIEARAELLADAVPDQDGRRRAPERVAREVLGIAHE
jgi:hypothetical protein